MRQLPVIAAPARQVLFHGKPSQVINLPDLLAGILAVTVVEVGFVYASRHWNILPAVAIAPALLVALRVCVQYLRTAFTEVIIDAERITRRRGILNRGAAILPVQGEEG